MADRLSTGVTYLDKQLGGGLAPGRIVCLRTEPGSQGELLLREAAICNGSLYLSTTRTDDAVADWLWPAGSLDIEYAGIDGLAPRGGDAVRQWVDQAAGWSGDGPRPDRDGAVQVEAVRRAVKSADGGVIIDPVNPLERAEEPAYLGLLHELQRRITETRSLGFVHVVESATVPECRWLTLQLADEVWDISVEVKSGKVSFLLTVTKSRSDDVPNRQVKLDLGQVVNVDTSRDIS